MQSESAMLWGRIIVGRAWPLLQMTNHHCIRQTTETYWVVAVVVQSKCLLDTYDENQLFYVMTWVLNMCPHLSRADPVAGWAQQASWRRAVPMGRQKRQRAGKGTQAPVLPHQIPRAEQGTPADAVVIDLLIGLSCTQRGHCCAPHGTPRLSHGLSKRMLCLCLLLVHPVDHVT